MVKDARLKSPILEGLKAGVIEFFKPPKGFAKDLVTAAFTGASLFFVVGAVKTLFPGTGLAGFDNIAGGAAFVLSFTACSSWWKAVTNEFTRAFDEAKSHNIAIQSPSLSPQIQSPSVSVPSRQPLSVPHHKAVAAANDHLTQQADPLVREVDGHEFLQAATLKEAHR